MTKPLPDPRLRKSLETIDKLKNELRAERIKSGNLKFRLVRALQATRDAKPKQDLRPSC